jgi:hypothetical protein
MTDKANEQAAQAEEQPKAPVVEIKTAKRRTTSKSQDAKPKPKPEVDLTELKRVSDEITRLEALRKDRLDLIQKAAKAGATTKAISDASSLSVPRLRQLITK